MWIVYGFNPLYMMHYNTSLCVFDVAIPAGICPMPFTLLGISVYCLYFGLYQTVPIYVSIIVSYLLICGSGLFRKMADRGEALAQARADMLAQEKKQEDGSESVPNKVPANTQVNSNPLNSAYDETEKYKKVVRPVAPRASEAGDNVLVSDV